MGTAMHMPHATRHVPHATCMAGDFNALREEYVYGNTRAFFDSHAVKAVRPSLRRPAPTAPLVSPPEPPLASLGPMGELRLHCPSCDGGLLVEQSARPGEGCSPAPLGVHAAAAGGTCTRAGSTMTIDFVLVGSVGGVPLSASPHSPVPSAHRIAAADPVDGIRHAVLHWGSDHLPVAADVELALPSTAWYTSLHALAINAGIVVLSWLAWRAWSHLYT